MVDFIRKSKWTVALAASPLLFVMHAAMAEVVVVSSPSFSADSLTSVQVKNMPRQKNSWVVSGTGNAPSA